MSDMAPMSQRNLPPGYASRTIQVAGVDMTFTFYMGFASRVAYAPAGGAEILVYQQEGTFHVPGGVGPDSRTTVSITGGPDQLDVELDVDDGPIGPPDYRGAIERFQVVTGRTGGGGGGGRVRAKKGGDKVKSIKVELRGEGGVFPHMPEDGGTTTVDNRAVTCPPAC